MKTHLIILKLVLSFLNIISVFYGHKYRYKLFDRNENEIQFFSSNFLSLKLQLSNISNTFEFQLIKNRILFPKNYQETLIDGESVLKLETHKNVRECYYDSKDDLNDPTFLVAVNFCDGLNGVIQVHGVEYVVNEIVSGEDGVKWVDVKAMEPSTKSLLCGVENDVNEKKKIRKKRNANETKYFQDFVDDVIRIIEIFIVIDYPVFKNMYGENKDKALRQTRNFVQVSNKLYQQQEIFVVLIGIEIWTKFHFPIPQGDQMEALSQLADERYDNLQFELPRHDVMLFSIMNPGVSAIGFAFVGTLCSPKYSTLWLNDQGEENILLTGILMTHEISHLFSLKHNKDGCECLTESKHCIMDTAVYKLSVSFSSCSYEAFSEAFKLKRDFCLHNLVVYKEKETLCGNGFVEESEECDCGGRSEMKCSRACCDENTCFFRTNDHECAAGLCCEVNNCRLKSSGTECRRADGECDMAENCDGKNGMCPKDEHHFDGKICGGDYYCYGGKCIYPNYNCAFIFGSDTRESPDECYDINTMGRDEGYCQMIYYGSIRKITACKEKDKLCGSSFCDTLTPDTSQSQSPFHAHWDVTYLLRTPPANSRKCVFTELLSGKFEINLGYAMNGKKCGQQKMCFERNCVDRQFILKGLHRKIIDAHVYYNSILHLQLQSIFFILLPILILLFIY